ncbi:MAG: murein biosynthesis integral membrane protein MurJ [Pseudomonadota bacterium]
MSEKKKIAKAAGIVGSATLLSRVLGLIRDQVTAYYFGAGVEADAFFVAFRIPNLLRRLLAEGALTASFIPIFSEYLTTRSRAEAVSLARAALTFFSLVLLLATILGIVSSSWLIRVFAPGFVDDPYKFQLTVTLTQVMFPYIFLVGLLALAMGILNSLDKFAGPALAPVFLNLGMILTVFFLYRFFDPPIMALAAGALIGGVMQLLVQVPYLAGQGGFIGLNFNFKHPALKRIVLLMAPATLGAAAYQISVFINTLLASYLPLGSVSYLYYADRIMQFPLGVFAVAMGTAVLPSMSRQAAANDLKALKSTLSYSLRLVSFITIPAAVGMIVLSEPIIRLLFQRGQFDLAASQATAEALIAYAVGLWSLSAVQVLARVFYSLKDTLTPVKISIVSLATNAVLCLILMWPLKHTGLALASSGGSVVNFILLTVFLRRRLGTLDGRRMLASLARNCLCAALMGAVVYATSRGLAMTLPEGTTLLAAQTGVGTLVGMGMYVGLSLVFKDPELKALIKTLRKR